VSIDAVVVERVVAALRHDGKVEVPDALPTAVLDALVATMDERRHVGFDRAGVGRDHRTIPTVRGDLIDWIDGHDPATRWYLDWTEQLRLELNRQLFLGLFEFESHFAWYPVGAFYATHVDAFRGESNRIVSTVVYLNSSWAPADGGELVIYEPVHDLDGKAMRVSTIVAPTYGTLVVFLSEEFPHEVLPAARPRRSIAGWYRLNATSSTRVDPPLG
jgi:SM-20-related protein